MNKVIDKEKNETLVSRYKFGTQYIPDYDEFKLQVLNKTIIPYQVEIQPPPRGKKICWLDCPYCYGASAEDTGDRFDKERCLKVLEEIADGGVKKIIFAGYATDPLNSSYIDDLLELVINRGQIFGFNTKALKVSERFINLLSREDIVKDSYVSVSVDAGSVEVYNAVHAVKSKAKIYDKVLKNVQNMGKARVESGKAFDISVTYLIEGHNNTPEEVEAFIKDFKSAGANLLRFTFAQPPRDFETGDGIIPSVDEKEQYSNLLRPIIEKHNTADCPILLIDADSEHGIFYKPRTLPCIARWTYPTVGFDGWLYHCSQSSSPNFRSMALGDLSKNGFWELFYNYNAENIHEYFSEYSKKMADASCRCDRKEHVVNSGVKTSGVFNVEFNKITDENISKWSEQETVPIPLDP